MKNTDYFELRRLSGDVVYEFDRQEKNGSFGYKRRDKDLWIVYDENYGWIAAGAETGEVQGRSWDILPVDQNVEYPPAGIWVSRKGIKSFVYELVYSLEKNS